MTEREPAEATGSTLPLDRRTVLKTTGLAAALSVGARAGAAASHQGQGQGASGSTPADIDPIFGASSAGPNPCAGDASEDCFEEFGQPVRPDHEVEVRIDLPGVLLAAAQRGEPSDETVASINEAAADGSLEGDDDVLHKPDEVVNALPGRTTVRDIARAVADMVGFHYHPAGLHVEPGDVVLFSAETPDHGVAAYHERHGRQNRVPDGVGPIASPLVPAGGYWLYRFETPGVYDFYCPPHQVFGMVLRVVVHDGEGPVPELSVEQTGRPPESENLLREVLGGLDPNLPSSMEALGTTVLAPRNIVANGPIPWEDVVAEHRVGPPAEGGGT